MEQKGVIGEKRREKGTEIRASDWKNKGRRKDIRRACERLIRRESERK
jgi:hypothetical protein